MAAEDQGIMSLPMGGQEPTPPMPELPLEESYDAINQGLKNAAPQAAVDIQQLMASITPQLDQLSDEDLAAFLQAIRYLYDGGEQEYAKRLQEVIASGLLDPGDLPEEYDPEVLSAIGTVLLQAQTERAGQMAQMAEPPPQQFARGGIAEAARMVASKGRNGDTMLAHITPDEARLLKARGGSGTINPKTGLPEFFLKSIGKAIKGVFKGVVSAVKGVLKSPIGRVLATVALATFLGPGAMGVKGLGWSAGAALGTAAATTTLASGGNLKEALVAGATGFFGAPGGAVSQYLGGMGITNAAANAAVTAGIVGTGAGLLTGQKLSNAVKSGLTAGAISGLATGIQKGFMSDVPGAPARPLAPVDDAVARPVGADGMMAPVPPPASVAAPAMRLNTETADMYTPLSDEAAAAFASSGPGRVPAAAPGIASVQTGLRLPPGAVPSAGEVAAGYAAEGAAPPAGGGGGSGGPFDTIKNFYQQNISPSGIQAAAAPAAQEAAAKAVADLVERMPDATPAMKEAAYQSAYKAAMPGVISTYGPAVGTGLGIMALAGGFKPNQPQPSALANQMRGTPGLDLINRNPSQYMVQGLPGVQYTPQGGIAGTSAWSPTATMQDVRVATPSYTGGLFGPMNYSSPYFAADGGLASLASGGYPRKTGAISGPGTEKSDSIPAMLSDGEFVMTAKAVRGLGGGSRREGAKKMYALMHQLERNASRG